MKTVLPLLFVALFPVACSRHTGGPGASQATTHTIAPATAQPGPDTSGTDAMTQTVMVDDSRSESDGMASASTTTAAKKAAATKAPAKKKGKK